ncbi:MAG: hypothetical protein LBE38_05965 [Deltaproteobacteria bacterium]|jgi:hypothetical protein|nr:hypothetical protein [Deltaproteobacteria bacterium]
MDEIVNNNPENIDSQGQEATPAVDGKLPMVRPYSGPPSTKEPGAPPSTRHKERSLTLRAHPEIPAARETPRAPRIRISAAVPIRRSISEPPAHRTLPEVPVFRVISPPPARRIVPAMPMKKFKGALPILRAYPMSPALSVSGTFLPTIRINPECPIHRHRAAVPTLATKADFPELRIVSAKPMRRTDPMLPVIRNFSTALEKRAEGKVPCEIKDRLGSNTPALRAAPATPAEIYPKPI